MNINKIVKVNNVAIGQGLPIVLIAGPCVIESLSSTLYHAEFLKNIAAQMGVGFIFKSSYDKANRSSVDSFRGPGISAGLRILDKVKEKLRIPVLSDVHCRSELACAAKVLDIIQIPALLSRQTELIVEAAKTGKVINIKKGQFMAPWDMANVVKKIASTGNRNILITERGTCFGYNNLVSDLRSLSIMGEFGCPVIFDATHSLQLPGAKGKSSGGYGEFIENLSRAAVAYGCDGLFLEVHRDPKNAPCDGPNMLKLGQLRKLLSEIKKIDNIVKGGKVR